MNEEVLLNIEADLNVSKSSLCKLS